MKECVFTVPPRLLKQSHFLLECSLCIKERREFLEKVNIYLPDNNTYATNEQNFVAIMSVTDALVKFIYSYTSEQKKCMYCNDHKKKLVKADNQSCKLINSQIELCVSIKVSI